MTSLLNRFVLLCFAASSFFLWIFLNQDPTFFSTKDRQSYSDRELPLKLLPAAPTATKTSYCYKENNSTILFLNLTNRTNYWLPLEMCAIKSAALNNNDTGVCVLTRFPMEQHECLKNLPNLDIAELNATRIFGGTPLESWYKSFVLNESIQLRSKRLLIWEMSDALRYAYLYKYGGKYMDTDTWTLKNLGSLRNVIGSQGDGVIANGIMFFDRGHPLMKAAMDHFVDNFQPGSWGSSGPRLISKIHNSNLVNQSTYLVLNPYIFYPLHYSQSHWPFVPKFRESTKQMVKYAYTLHLWRSMRYEFWNPGVLPTRGSFAFEFMRDVCGYEE